MQAQGETRGCGICRGAVIEALLVSEASGRDAARSPGRFAYKWHRRCSVMNSTFGILMRRIRVATDDKPDACELRMMEFVPAHY